MKRSITYNGDIIEYELTIKTVKNMNLRVKRDRSIHVSASRHIAMHSIDAFVIDHVPFIERARLGYKEANKKRPDPLSYVTGEEITISGKPVQLRVVSLLEHRKAYATYDGQSTLYMYVKEMATIEEKKEVMARFWRTLGDRIFSQYAALVYERFHKKGVIVPIPKVKQQVMKSRWGSCTPSKGIIKMNTRLLEGPEEYIEYVMVHEFSHFIYLDHSPRFYALVETFLPDWKVQKRKLNEFFRYK